MFGDFLRIRIPCDSSPLPFGANLNRFAAHDIFDFSFRGGPESKVYHMRQRNTALCLLLDVFVAHANRVCLTSRLPCFLGYQYMVMFRNSEKAPEQCWERETKGSIFLCNIDFYIHINTYLYIYIYTTYDTMHNRPILVYFCYI